MSSLTLNTTAERLHLLLPATVFPVTVAVMILSAPAAYALTEQQIADECRAAGGTYTTSIDPGSGNQDSSCCYKDIKGNKYCDYYLNGKFVGTGPGRVNPEPTSTVQPAQPPSGTAPAAPGVPPAGPHPVHPVQPGVPVIP
jgi:hypothetical protein